MARSPKLPKVKRGEMRYVMVTDKRDNKKYRTLTSVMPGTGFPVICEIPSNLHRKGEKRGMLLTHDKIVKGEVHATRDHFIEGYKKLKKLEASQGLPPEEQTRYYEATMAEMKPSSKETTAMSSISTLIASSSKKIHPVLRHAAPGVDSLITAKATVHKAVTKKKASVKPAAPTKSMGGLEKKLDALSKKYPGVTFKIQALKTKQNQIVVSGIGKLTQKELHELFKKIPNTNHIPNKMAAGTATFTLFGKKELTGSEVKKPHHPSDPHIDKLEALRKVMNAAEFAFKKKKTPENKAAYLKAKENYMALVKNPHHVTAAAERKNRPYYVLLEGLKVGGNGWTIQFGDYDKKVVDQELIDTRAHNRGNGEKKLQYKVIKVANARQKTIDEAVKALTASDTPARTTFKVN